MNTTKFKPKAYVKDGCPFSFKFLVFMAEAGLLSEIEIVRLRESAPDFEVAKQQLAQRLGKSATFPTVEIEPDRYMTDSDRVIEHFAEREGLRPSEWPVLSFYKETIFPQLGELFQLKKAGKASVKSS
jgi:hypothetical protein